MKQIPSEEELTHIVRDAPLPPLNTWAWRAQTRGRVAGPPRRRWNSLAPQIAAVLTTAAVLTGAVLVNTRSLAPSSKPGRTGAAIFVTGTPAPTSRSAATPAPIAAPSAVSSSPTPHPASTASISHPSPPPPLSVRCPNPGAVTSWAPPGAQPLTDAQAAACVVHAPEVRSDNAQANDYVPSAAELQVWRAALVNQEHTPEAQNVDGLDGLSSPSTDDLIQWTAHKWGIPEDWIRAQMVVQSHWHQSDLGNLTTVSASDYGQYPPQAQAGGNRVYQSMGVMQVRWTPSSTDMAVGTEPLRWKSTAFNLDFYAAVTRWYYDGNCNWCGSGYAAGQQWNSIGAWYQPTPWANSGAQNYVAQVQSALAARAWAQPGF